MVKRLLEVVMLHFCDEFTNDDGDEDFKFMKRFCTLIILFTVTVKMLVAQDVHFSQYYATPLTINPSYTGSFTAQNLGQGRSMILSVGFLYQPV